MELNTRSARVNSGLGDFVNSLSPGGGSGYGPTISQPWTLALNSSAALLSLNRTLLSDAYVRQGLIQVVVRQPVDDAFSGGFTIASPELDDDDVKRLMATITRSRKRDKANRKLQKPSMSPNAFSNLGDSDIAAIMDTLTWARLYGGAGLIVNTEQDFSTELDEEAITADSPLEFIAADRWELILSASNIYDLRNPTPFNFYGFPLHRSRVVKVSGITAPSWVRLRLQGWGMSEIERCIRAINSFVKFETLIFELIDEAKVDVYSITGFNDNLLSDDGTANTTRRVQLANQLKNFQNALVMDKEDEWTQKQISWSGLAELWEQLRLNLSSSLKIPMNKLFGESATGFGGGQDAQENYNSIIRQVRANAEPLVCEVVDLRCQQLFGFIPEYVVEWRPLKEMSGEEEEKVKTSKQKRTLDLFQQRLITGKEASDLLKKDGILPIDTEVSKGLRDVEPTLPNAGEPSEGQMEMAKAKTEKPEPKKKAA